MPNAKKKLKKENVNKRSNTKNLNAGEKVDSLEPKRMCFNEGTMFKKLRVAPNSHVSDPTCMKTPRQLKYLNEANTVSNELDEFQDVESQLKSYILSKAKSKSLDLKLQAQSEVAENNPDIKSIDDCVTMHNSNKNETFNLTFLEEDNAKVGSSTITPNQAMTSPFRKLSTFLINSTHKSDYLANSNTTCNDFSAFTETPPDHNSNLAPIFNSPTQQQIISTCTQQDQELSSLTLPKIAIKEIFYCFYCDLAFSVGSECIKHEGTHNKKTPYACHFCELALTDHKNLIMHIKYIHSTHKAHICTLCKTGFYRRRDLKKHTVLHTGVRPYTCGLCGKAFSRNANLQKHLLLHTAEQPFMCSSCRKDFTNSMELTHHMKTHKDRNFYECNKCIATFSCLTKLKIHQKMHAEPLVTNTEIDLEVIKKNSITDCILMAIDNSTHSLKDGLNEEEIKIPLLQNLYGEGSDSLSKQESTLKEKLCIPVYYDEHLSKHLDELHYCNECGMTYISKEKLQQHKIDRHGVGNVYLFSKYGNSPTVPDEFSPEYILTFVVANPNLSLKELCKHFNIPETETSENVDPFAGSKVMENTVLGYKSC